MFRLPELARARAHMSLDGGELDVEASQAQAQAQAAQAQAQGLEELLHQEFVHHSLGPCPSPSPSPSHTPASTSATAVEQHLAQALFPSFFGGRMLRVGEVPGTGAGPGAGSGTLVSSKRKRNTNALDKRLEIIERIERKEITQAEGSRILNVGKAAVSRMMKDKERIRQKMAEGCFRSDAKRARSAAFPELEQRVFKFVELMRKRKLNVPGSMIQARALKEAEHLQVTNFKASQGWLENFKCRFGLKGTASTSGTSAGAQQPMSTGSLRDEDVIEIDQHDLLDAPSPLSVDEVFERINDIERFASTHNVTELIGITRNMSHILHRKTAERHAHMIQSEAVDQPTHADVTNDLSSSPHNILHAVDPSDLLAQVADSADA